MQMKDVQVAFGRGVGKHNSESDVRNKIHDCILQPNFKGNSLSTRFLSGMMLRSHDQEDPGALDQLMELVVADMAALGWEGFQLRDQGKIWLIPLGSKGDWSYLVDIAKLNRSYRNSPKAATSKSDDHGICHLCYAGLAGYPYEDVCLAAL